MDISKRGFLKIIGTLPIVGPSIAKEASDLSKLNIGRVSLGSVLMDETSKEEDNWGDNSYVPRNKSSLFKRLNDIKNRAEFLKKKGLTEFERQQWSRSYTFGRLDVDLAVNRSMSLSAKMHIQKERDWKIYEFDQIHSTGDKNYILERLNNKKIIKEMRKLGILEEDDPRSEQSAKNYYDDNSNCDSSVGD